MERQEAELQPAQALVALDGQDRQYLELRHWLSVPAQPEDKPFPFDVESTRVRCSPAPVAPPPPLKTSASE